MRAKALQIPGRSCALSSVVEHYLHTVGVTGSNPVARTIFFSHSTRLFDAALFFGTKLAMGRRMLIIVLAVGLIFGLGILSYPFLKDHFR